MKKTMLVVGCALILGSTMTASEFATDWLYSREQQQDLIDNLTEVYELQSCIQQQQEALQRFLAIGLSYNNAALMAHSQYPCDSTDR